MTEKILVTYASRSGSTAGTAEAIAQHLRAAGLEVDLAAMQEVQDLAAYQAVVVGSAIRGSKWLPEAAAFIQTNQEILRQKPLAMFTVCITMAMSNAEKYRQGVAGWVAPLSALVHPVSAEYFPGMLDFKKLPINFDTLMLRIAVATGIFPKGDHRNWPAVESWANSIVPLLTH